MANQQPLDLAEIDPPRWRIMTGDTVYGPYTLGQMRSFVSEARLTVTSKVADGDGGAFIEAREHTDLKPLFSAAPARARKAPQTEPSNLMVIIRHTGDSRATVLNVLNELGRFAEMMPGAYLLSSTERVSQIRLQLAEAAAPGDQIVIVNASTGRLAWAGLGTETDALVRSVWTPKA
ncbi:MAG: hypothetical protein QNI84_09130 [Henriciella sp.]|nr:hypothetical protein [Henriciella sp.]